MLSWLENQMHAGQEATSIVVLQRITAATLLGFVVAGIYYFTRPKNDHGTKGLVATIVLLSILLSMVVLAIGNNIAHAFSLAGVLAIVRFRTVVEDTRDSAFVICAVVVGMAAGAGYLSVALIGLPFVAGAAYLTQNQQLRKVSPASILHMRFQITSPLQQPVEGILQKYAEVYTVKNAGVSKKGTSFDMTYRLRMKSNMHSLDLVRELKVLEGMQCVEWNS